jgi:E3 ubiquitin-protein ligase RAD18
MDPSMDIPDSTDWLNTPLRQFSELENALHCEICKEFYDTPMITSCSHTFCSKCIRTSLSADGKCPSCRKPDQASKLRNNWALQSVVATFLAARPTALSLARKETELAAKRPAKRKRAVLDSDDAAQVESEGRATRSKSRRVTASQTSQTEPIEIGDSEDDEDGDFEPEQPVDGLVECPLGCGRRMKIEQVDRHLDRCEDEKKQAARKSRTPVNGLGSSRLASRQTLQPEERLAELHYSMLRDTALRKKMVELGIPNWGTKPLLVKRHTEWVNIWNANCDSDHPRTKNELLRDLDRWEKSQGGRAPYAPSAVSSVMRKDFDGAAWAQKNKDEFSRLIADARRKKSNSATAAMPPKSDDAPVGPHEPASDKGKNSDGPPPASQASNPPPPQLKSESSQPYADHPEAIQSIRAKVEALNAGKQIEPVMNEGFKSTFATTASASFPANGIINGESHASTRKPSDPATGAQNAALMEQNHFGQGRKASEDEHTVHHNTGHACDLPAHLSPSPKKVPMFTVPQDPVSDLDGGGEGTQVQ